MHDDIPYSRQAAAAVMFDTEHQRKAYTTVIDSLTRQLADANATLRLAVDELVLRKEHQAELEAQNLRLIQGIMEYAAEYPSPWLQNLVEQNTHVHTPPASSKCPSEAARGNILPEK